MSEPRIELKGVLKQFGNFTAVERLNMTIHAGEFIVLLGPSGCGKTTTLRMMAGLETVTEGHVLIDGRDVTTLPPGDRDIAFVFQMFALYPHLTAEKNIAFPLRAAKIPSQQIKQRIDTVIHRLGLETLRHRRPRTLSGGDQQRVSLARAMVREPKAFLMDEPLGTLDADQREKTRTELRAIHNELRANGGTTIFVTHDQLEALSLADRIAVMHDGKLLQFDTPRQVYENPADLFVANFIGSPGMNLLTGNLTPDGTFHLEATDETLPGPKYGVKQLALQKLVMGIRPESVRIAKDGLKGIVEHTELLGAFNLIELRLGKNLLKARVATEIRPAAGSQVYIRFEESGVRWFEHQSGKAIAMQNGSLKNQ